MSSQPLKVFYPVFERYAAEARREVWRLQAGEDALGEESDVASYIAWKNGRHAQAIELFQDPDHQKYVNFCHTIGSYGVAMTRVRLLRRPLSVMLEWDLAHLAHCNSQGETVLTVEADELPTVPTRDVIIFDTNCAMELEHRDGNLVSFEVFEKPDEVARFLALKSLVRSQAQPLERALEEIPHAISA